MFVAITFHCNENSDQNKIIELKLRGPNTVFRSRFKSFHVILHN